MATSKFNRSKISKSAWNLVKAQGLTLSQAMKQAWAEAKAPKADFKNGDILFEGECEKRPDVFKFRVEYNSNKIMVSLFKKETDTKPSAQQHFPVSQLESIKSQIGF